MLQALYSTAIYIVPFVFVLTVVVFFHELGHFLVGRWCGIKVDAFSIGFGPELFAFTDRKGTRWRVAGLCTVPWNMNWRPKATFTGWPSARAARGARV